MSMMITMMMIPVCLLAVKLQSRRGKRSKGASVGADLDGVCITYTRSQPPSTARVLEPGDNVFLGAFPPHHGDHWLQADDADRDVNDLFEKASERRVARLRTCRQISRRYTDCELESPTHLNLHHFGDFMLQQFFMAKLLPESYQLDFGLLASVMPSVLHRLCYPRRPAHHIMVGRQEGHPACKN